jgi:isopentenyl-diphosphate delta-isomerase type 1
MAPTEYVILVDQNDQVLGVEEKIKVHQKGLCHRAFSVFIYRKTPSLEILLQKRASHKYHSPNLWTNTCCSHPRPGEDTIKAGERRLEEEMGIRIPLQNIGCFHYIAHFDNGLIENEMDHVLIGAYVREDIQPNPEEVAAYRWIKADSLQQAVQEDPGQFTPWLSSALEMVLRHVDV